MLIATGAVPVTASAIGTTANPCDIDADGYADLVIGAPNTDGNQPTEVDSGSIVILPGGADGPDPGRSWRVTQDLPGIPDRNETGDRLGNDRLLPPCQEGDVLLRELSALMRESIRKKDSVARWGGEEFVVMCPGTGEHVAARLADELRRTIAEHPFKGGESQPQKKITISAGVAAFSQNRDKASLIQAADEALYEAKHKGRNCVCVASDKEKVA